jgi:hypothetical protein
MLDYSILQWQVVGHCGGQECCSHRVFGSVDIHDGEMNGMTIKVVS